VSIEEFRLPDPGEGLTEAEVVTWKVKVGDTVKVNDIVVEIETAKSLVELPVPFAGVVSALLVSEGQVVEVGTPIIAVETGAVPAGGGAPTLPPPTLSTARPDAAAPTAPATPATPGTPGTPPGPGGDEAIEVGKIGGLTSTGRTAVLVGYGVKHTEAKRRPRKGADGGLRHAALGPQMVTTQDSARAPELVAAAASRHTDVDVTVPVTADHTDTPTSVRALAKPPVRKYAKDRGVDLATVAGTGAGGTVTRADIDAALLGSGGETGAAVGSGSAYAPVVGASRGDRGETRIPIKGVRKMMAAAMVGSAFTAPHVTEWITVDVTATMELVDRLRADREFADVKVTPLTVLAKAMCVAARRHPGINSSWDEAAQEIVVKGYVNLGIAAATPRGLIVPNIKDADLMTMLELAAAIGSLTATAREGRTQPAEMAGGTITITNVGVFGVDTGTPILNPGEAAIVALGAIRKQPWVVTGPDGEDELAIRHVTYLGMSFDHRLVDGELGSRYLADIAAILHDPARGLVWG
jgi:pyruvate dehydrogenase E2 component (dihydrolipoamide acetyltransferase)